MKMSHRRIARSLILTAIAAASIAGCSEEKVAEVTPPPPPTYTGPEFLRGTIGSVTGLRGFEPVLVSGYGLVVGLEGTGSPDVPPVMREWLLEEMTRRGFGSAQTGMPSAERVLASSTAAVVLVEGIIPPGATEGTRFDVLVRALPETQTTSLEGGTLYTMPLRVGGANFGASQLSDIANARGPIFLNPFLEPGKSAVGTDDDPRVGRVLSGGMVTGDMTVQIVTNQESYRLTSQIANRINGRFPQSPADKQPVAVAKDANVVQINTPLRYKDNPKALLDVIQHMYLNPTADFTQTKAMDLAKMLQDPENAQFADDVALAWEGMGKTILTTLRSYYDDKNPTLRLAALQAGARLEDSRTADALNAIAQSNKGPISEKATNLLGDLVRARPDNQRVMLMLRQLLDSDDALVRLAAMQSLIDAKDTSVQGNRFPDKLEIVRVRCEKPMIYVTRSGTPRIAIFNDRLGFHQPMMFTTGENRFMLRSDAGQTNAGLFYQRPGAGRAVKQDIPSNVAYLVGTMAYKPTEDSRSTPGLDMSYSDIVRVLFQLTQKQKYVDAPFVLQPDHLIEQITARRSMLDMTTGGRKESTPDRKETIPGEKEKTQAAPAAPNSRPEK